MHSYNPSDHHHRKLRNLLNPRAGDESWRGKNAAAVGAVVLVLVALVAVWWYLNDDSAEEVVLNVIALRKGPPEVVKKSALITTTTKLVDRLSSKRIKNEWESLAECMVRGCSDVEYYNFIVTVITQKRVSNSELVYNIILTNKYWGTNELIEFSQALTKVNDGVEALGSREVQKRWNEIIQCDGKCPEKDDLFFQMVKSVIMAG